MKKFTILIFVMSSIWASAQNPGCESRLSSGSASFHYMRESSMKVEGAGLELGEQGISRRLSWFLGITFAKMRIEKADSSLTMMYAKVDYRINSEYSPVKISLTAGPVLRAQDISYMAGVRILWVAAPNLGLSLEPLYSAGVIQTRAAIHLLL